VEARFPLSAIPSLRDRLDQSLFNAIYSRSLVYNCCWEDPAVDRKALDLRPDDTMLVITSAGCNVLDYALTGPARIHSVDANPRQTALLELKLAGIKGLEFDDFFAIFGAGHHADFRALYLTHLQPELSEFAKSYWDKRTDWFARPKTSFYFHGLSGIVARAFRAYMNLHPGLHGAVTEMFAASSLIEQRRIYDTRIAPRLWRPGVNWVLSRQFTMNMLGVPHPQRKQVEAQHDNGIAGFIREAVDYVFRELPLAENYFWSVYVRGHYTRDCCPEYLKPANFAALKAGRADCIVPHTSTITDFLRGTDERISKYVLLDHMDWMTSYYPEALAEEWGLILDRAAPNAKIIFRSAHAAPAYLDNIRVGEDRTRIAEYLTFNNTLAGTLQAFDRVHTYAGFHVADVKA
jgi:S-adenosylmethionine-diacylglycerol 3-amino-3-carboxypropyl transferase